MQRRKPFYFPVFISLFGLLGIFLVFRPVNKPVQFQRSSIVWLPYDKEPKSDRTHKSQFTKQLVYQKIKGKKVVEVDLDDYELIEEKKRFIVREFQRMQFTGDTLSVLKIDFGCQNTFGQFIWILNLAQIYHVKRYAFTDDSFILFANPFVRSVDLCHNKDGCLFLCRAGF